MGNGICNIRSSRLVRLEVGQIDLVHVGEILHVGEEDVDFDGVVERCAGGFEDGGEVLDALVLHIYHSFRQKIHSP